MVMMMMVMWQTAPSIERDDVLRMVCEVWMESSRDRVCSIGSVCVVVVLT